MRRLAFASLFLCSCATDPKFLSSDVSWKEYTTPPAMGALTFPNCIATDRKLHVFSGIREGSPAPSNNQGFSFDLDLGRWQAWPQDKGPKSLQNYATAWTPKGIFVFGGVADKPSADAFLFQTESMHWQALPGAEKHLQARSQATATTVDNKVLIFGGRGKTEKLNAAIYDAESGTFSPLLLPPNLQSRFSHVAVALGHKLFLWGGFQGGKRRADGFMFDVVEQTWTPLPKAPLSARANAKAVVVGAQVYILGGMNDQGQSRDGAVFDLATLSWRPLPWIADPAYAGLHNFELVSVGKSGLMLSGGKLGEKTFNRQAWYLDFAKNNWQKVSALNVPRGSIGSCVVRNEKGTIFVLGGLGGSETEEMKQHEGLWFLPVESIF